ncbi:ATP-binding protein [Streptomyces sp. NPDC007905]|uniref:ATP-binding protein n=1 Tax=Streptomyces sp. NPDC007905 TaxID=3364788 RepID=UPI0036E4C84A
MVSTSCCRDRPQASLPGARPTGPAGPCAGPTCRPGHQRPQACGGRADRTAGTAAAHRPHPAAQPHGHAAGDPGTAAAEDALLLLSETLTNAVQHAAGPVGLRLCRTFAELTVEVSDHSPQLPQPRLAAQYEESGRGLLLVRGLAESWGVRPTDEGKTTWFTLKL